MQPITKGQLMDAPTTRIFRPARVVALGLIALAVLALGYLRFAAGEDPVSVPSGATAGQLTLEECEYPTEDGSYAADCGTLVVPENRADPQSRLIALPVTRIRARSETPGTPVFRLEGGPGKTNMEFSKASRLAANHDVVLVGYRGADGSSVLDCPEVESAVARSADILGRRSFDAYAAAFRSCADRLTDEGVDLAGYSLPQRVDDLEAARKALGYDRINLVSESAGTRTAMIYSWRYPKSVHRSVMIAVNPPGGFLWDGETTDEQIGRYADLCAKDEACSKRTDDLAATMRRTSDEIPSRWGLLPIEESSIRVGSLYGLVETTSEAAPLSSPMTIGGWLSAAEGDASGFWLLSFMADLVFPKAFIWGEMAAAARADVNFARDRFAAGRPQGDSIGEAATSFIWGGGGLADAWPATPDEDAYDRVRTTTVETLLVGGELDMATPPQLATKEVLPHLPNGHQVVLEGFGHSTDFWTYQPEASTRLINTFFDSGEVDDSLYTPQKVDFTPEVTHTALGKGFAGTMAGLAILVVLSLLWMARRARRRGGFGRKAGATLRSLYAVVLGLGGWLLGVLFVLIALPTVALDSELLAVLSIGVPVGLGVYLASFQTGWSAFTKLVGFAAAAAGAFAGTWLGFNATADLLALVTGIVGAVAGANLALILLDIARERSTETRRTIATGPQLSVSKGVVVEDGPAG